MKKHIRFLTLGLLLCILTLLVSCGTAPVETTAPSTAPTETTAPTEPRPTPQQLYDAAVDTLRPDQKRTVSHLTERTIRGQTYSSMRKATVVYTGFGTANMTAVSNQTVSYGDYTSTYTEQFQDGTAYIQVQGMAHTYQTEMTREEYTARELPAVLLEFANYNSVTATESDGITVLTFSGAIAPERWVTEDPAAELISAGGTATINAEGVLTRTAYTADYRIGQILYRVEASVVTELPKSGEGALNIPTDAIRIAVLDAPLMVPQVVGDVFSAESISATAQELLVANAAALVRNSQTEINLHGTGSAFLAKVKSSVSLTNYTGQTVSTTQTELFRNGSYTYTVDGGIPTTEPGVTATVMRSGCEDLLLSYLMDMGSISAIDIADTGDFWLLTLNASAQYCSELEDWVYTLIGVDLNNYATSASLKDCHAYLAINKTTHLPTSMGIRFAYAHTIEGVTYDLTYDCAQSIDLCSGSSYKAVTGALAPEIKPAGEARPLFYKVTDREGRTLWLLGTIHVGDERTAYLPQEIYDALNMSGALAVEMDVNAFEARLETDAELQKQIAAGYYFSDNTTIASLLNAEQYQFAKNLMLISGNYLPTSERMKPSLWENTITNFLLRQSSSLIPEKGVDQRLMTIAAKASKPIYDIEDPVSHMLLMTKYSLDLQKYLLSGISETTLAEYGADIAELYELWCKGDVKALTEAIAADNSEFTQEEADLYAEYYQLMTADRNRTMFQKAQEYLESGETVFFAVGLAHVLGEDGLVALLRGAGYTVEKVYE